MSPSTTFPGRMVSPGVATGQAFLGGTVAATGADGADETGGAGQAQAGSHSAPLTPAAAPAESATPADAVRAAFAAVAAERFALAERLRTEGRDDQAAIVEIAGLMAGDPALTEAAAAAVTAGTGPVAAVTGAATAQADILAALPNEDLAARAADVRQVGQAVVAQLTSAAAVPPPAGDFVLIQREVDPADLIRLADEGLTGAVSVTGGASSHAAIIARGLGLPMLAGVDAAVLDVAAGQPVLVDAADPARARLILNPDPAGLPPGTSAPLGTTETPSVHRTADGQKVTLLVNAASAREVRMGLAAGAAGVGLLRTEIPFVGATTWPTRTEHEAALGPVLSLLAGRPAVVRLLDFSGDKVPPFLAGPKGQSGQPDQAGPEAANGLTSLLGAPQALDDQLHAILAAGRDTDLRIMVPMVTTTAELSEVAAAPAAVDSTSTIMPRGGGDTFS